MKFKPVQASHQALSGVRIFKGLSTEECSSLAQLCSAGLYDANQSVVSAQDDTHDVYFVASGKVRVTILSKSGKEVSFRERGPGSSFGDLSAIDGNTRSASVVTLEDSLVVRMSADVFWDALQRYPSMNREVLKELANLVRLLSERVIEFSTLGVNNRLHAELLRLAKEAMTGENSARIVRPPTHAALASRISSHREAITRELQELSKSGVLEKHQGSLIVNDVERLAQMVSQVKAGQL